MRTRVDRDVDSVAAGVRDHLDRCGIEEQAAVGVVDVDHTHDRATRLEQQRLGPEVLLDRPVEVEVIAAEVREHGGVERRAVDAVHRQRVRRDLHHDGAVAVAQHRREAGLQLGRLRRRERARQRADHARRVAGGTQDRCDERAGRGLAAGAGDADDPERRRRVAVDGRRDRPEGAPRVVDHELAHRADHVRRQRVVDEQRAMPRRGRRRARTRARRGVRRAGRRTCLPARPRASHGSPSGRWSFPHRRRAASARRGGAP